MFLLQRHIVKLGVKKVFFDEQHNFEDYNVVVVVEMVHWHWTFVLFVRHQELHFVMIVNFQCINGRMER
jgi:hypothetical protein